MPSRTTTPRRVVLPLEPEVREALARSAADNHRPVHYEAEHIVVLALIEQGYLERPEARPSTLRLRPASLASMTRASDNLPADDNTTTP